MSYDQLWCCYPCQLWKKDYGEQIDRPVDDYLLWMFCINYILAQQLSIKNIDSMALLQKYHDDEAQEGKRHMNRETGKEAARQHAEAMSENIHKLSLC